MAISNVTTDYTGRTKDLFISQGINPRLSTTEVVTYDFGKLSYVVTGVQKLAQRYLITLFNAGFISTLRSVANAGVSVIAPTFASINGPIVGSFRSYQAQNPGMPLDEQLNTVNLDNYSLTSAGLNISLSLITNAGNTVTFVLPVSIV